MKASTDPTDVSKAWLETPFGAPRNPRTEREAFETPGCHVKSKEMDGRWPRYYGRLTQWSTALCVVVSKAPQHGIDGKPTVWVGTSAEYERMWRCD